MSDYRLAKSYEEQGYRIDTSSIVTENNKLYANIVCDCWKCGGKGVIPYFGHVDSGVCFACGGSGKFGKRARVYTTEEREKMDAAAERKRERDLEKKKAEAAAKRQAWMDKYNLHDGNIFIVAGCNSFEIKDQLKAQGAKFYSGLGWFFGTETVPNEEPLVEGEFLFHCTVDDMFYWNEVGGGPYYNEGALDEMQADIKEIIAKKNKDKFGASQHVGEVGDRLRGMKGIFLSAKYFESNWGGSFIYTFKVDDNIFTWFSQSVINPEIKPNDEIILTGTVKSHTEYNGVLQTQLSRCIVKKGSEQ